MAKTVRTSGDYTIKAGDGYNSGSGTNTINLDSLNVSITGNLEVGGTSSTISTTNTVIEDNIIELQTGISASTNDSGIIIERGSTGNNACIIWDESADTFKLGTTTATGADKSGGITVTAVALEVAALTATTGTFTGAVTLSGGITTGAITTNEIASNGSNADINITPQGTGKVVINNLSIDGELGNITSDSSNMDITVTPHGTGDFRVDGHIGLKVQAGDAAADGDHAHVYAKDDTGSAEVYVRDEAGNVTKLSPHNRQGNWEYFSRNVITGKVVRIDMEKMVRKLEELTGERFIENA